MYKLSWASSIPLPCMNRSLHCGQPVCTWSIGRQLKQYFGVHMLIKDPTAAHSWRDWDMNRCECDRFICMLLAGCLASCQDPLQSFGMAKEKLDSARFQFRVQCNVVFAPTHTQRRTNPSEESLFSWSFVWQ